MSQVDLLASLAALSGQKVDAKDSPDSQNQLPAFLGETTTGRTELVEQGGGNNDLALRSGQWELKLARDPVPQLFGLASDTHEEKDVAGENPAKVAQLQTRLQEISH